MKNLIKLISISFILFLISCAVSKENWHEAVSKIGGQSIYIEKDGLVSAKINNKISDNPRFNVFDSKNAHIGYGAIKILYKDHALEYKRSPDYNSVYILDLRSGQKDFNYYNEIIKRK